MSSRDLSATHPLLAEVAAARTRAMSVLDALRADDLSGSAVTEATVALQEAANKLGIAEARLAELIPAAQADPAAPADVSRTGPENSPAPVLQPTDRAPRGEAMRWSGEARAAMALAESTVVYADGRPDEVDRWLRVLRREGAVGRALADLGFPGGELTERAGPAQPRNPLSLTAVEDRATQLARQRAAESLTTSDLLFAVLGIYGALADRALYERGIARHELLVRLADGAGARAVTLPG